ncbi:hypothetical protein GCM10022280_04810 [Sphingomonas swuensis]|uniref:Uncharacterized protein n=1 Tax=Sphingomonas swuensis TaxID=977800 RepID=A0ABP7SEA0_9SPHN
MASATACSPIARRISGVTKGGRRFLDHFLVAALDAALALAEVEDVAVLVAEQLDLDMARALDELLDEHPVVAEAGEALALGRLEAVAHVLFGPGEAHALAAAAGRGLHHHRIADLARDPDRIVGGGDVTEEARDDIHPGRLGEFLGFDLVAHRRNGIRRRADEGDVLGHQRLDEGGALGQEAVARVHRLGAGLLAGGNDEFGLEIAFACRRRTEANGLVGHPHVRGAGIGIRIDRDGLDAHALGGADHPAGDFAAVGDQDLGEH